MLSIPCRNILALLVASAAIGLSGCSVAKDALKKHYLDKGNALAAQGKHKEASLAFRKAIQRDANFGEAYYRLSLSELRIGGNPQRALMALQKTVRLQPENAEARSKLADIYLVSYMAQTEKPKALLDEVEGAANWFLSKDRNSFEGHKLKGYLAWYGGRRAEALQEFRAAAGRKDLDHDVTMATVQILALEGQQGEAERLARKMIARDPEFGSMYDLLFELFLRGHRYDEGEAVLQAKAKALPRESGPLLQLAAHHFRLQKFEAMKGDLARITNQPGVFPTANLMVGDFYRAAGSVEEATRHYQQGLRSGGKDQAQYQKRLASVLALQGKREEAARMYGEIARQEPQDKESLLAHANLLMDSDVEEATKEFESLVKQMPNNPVAHFNLGRARAARRQNEAASREFREAIRLRRDYMPARMALTQLELDSGRNKEALELANEALSLDARNPQGRLYRATAYIGLQQFNEARKELSGVLKDFPDFSEAILQLAFVDLAEKRYKEAYATLDKLYSSTNDTRALRGMRDLLLAQKQRQEARQLMWKEMQKQPNSQSIRLLYAQTGMAVEDYSMAAEQYRQLAAAEKRWPYIHLRLGEACQLGRDFECAVASFRKAKELDPQAFEPTLRLAYALDQAGKNKEALAAYREAQGMAPNHPLVLNNLAYMITETGGNLDEAYKLVERVLRLYPNDRYVQDTMGWIYLKKGMTDSAMQIFLNLVRQYPDEVEVRHHLALALLKKGDRQKAKQELQIALSKNPPKNQADGIRQTLEENGLRDSGAR